MIMKRKIEAMKFAAWELHLFLDSHPSNMEAYRPIRNGVVADFDVTAMLIHEYLVRTESLSLFNRPVVLVSTPESCTEVERFALENAIFAAGAKAVGTVKSSIAAAVGAGLKINSPRGCMIVDIGGGMTQVAVISSGGIVRSRAVKLAGEKLDSAIVNSLRTKRDLYVGEMTAEMLKVRIGSAVQNAERGLLDVSGRNERLKCAQTIRVGTEDIYGAIHMGLEAICRTITGVLESTPPELAGDISESVFGYRFIIPAIGLSLAYVLTPDLLETTLIATGMLIGYFVYRRSVRIKIEDIITVAMCIAVSFIRI